MGSGKWEVGSAALGSRGSRGSLLLFELSLGLSVFGGREIVFGEDG